MRLAQYIETHILTGDAADTVTLDYEARFLRRKRLVSDGGEPFLVELAETQSLSQGEGFRLDDGRIIAVMVARSNRSGPPPQITIIIKVITLVVLIVI